MAVLPSTLPIRFMTSATPVRKHTGTAYAAQVRGNHDHILQVFLFNVICQNRRSRHMIQRDVEEALDLGRMQVDGQHPGDACALQNIRHQLGRNGFTAPGLAILTGVTIKGDHRNDMIGGGALERISHDQQFHDIVIDNGSACRLDNKYIFAANALIDHGLHFAVVEPVDDRIA